jgi:hypothetical protein
VIAVPGLSGARRAKLAVDFAFINATKALLAGSNIRDVTVFTRFLKVLKVGVTIHWQQLGATGTDRVRTGFVGDADLLFLAVTVEVSFDRCCRERGCEDPPHAFSRVTEEGEDWGDGCDDGLRARTRRR